MSSKSSREVDRYVRLVGFCLSTGAEFNVNRPEMVFDMLGGVSGKPRSHLEFHTAKQNRAL